MEGAELAVRFSYMPNALRYCGPEEAHGSFLSYLSNKGARRSLINPEHESCSSNNHNNSCKGKTDSVKESLKRFEGLYPYLAAIAEKTEKDFIDYDVVEAYWLGNKGLELFGSIDIKKIIAALVKRGLPESVANDRIKNLSGGMVPHHNFHVLYVGVGQVTGTVPTNLKTMDSCMIAEGTVEKVTKEKLLVKRRHLAKSSSNKLILAAEETAEAAYMKRLLPRVKKGDKVALHWGFAPMALTKQQAENLNKYTSRILNILNESGAAAIR